MKIKNKKLTFPISDTIAGPGTYEGKVITGEPNKNNEIPAVDTEESIDQFGFGTAKDVTTSTEVPENT